MERCSFRLSSRQRNATHTCYTWRWVACDITCAHSDQAQAIAWTIVEREGFEKSLMKNIKAEVIPCWELLPDGGKVLLHLLPSTFYSRVDSSHWPSSVSWRPLFAFQLLTNPSNNALACLILESTRLSDTLHMHTHSKRKDENSFLQLFFLCALPLLGRSW